MRGPNPDPTDNFHWKLASLIIITDLKLQDPELKLTDNIYMCRTS